MARELMSYAAASLCSCGVYTSLMLEWVLMLIPLAA